MGHIRKTVKGEKGRQHQTAQNSNIFLTGSRISLPSTPPPPSSRWGGAESVALPLAWHCATPRCTRCHWNCSRCQSRTRSCSRTHWSSRSRRWNGPSQLRVPPAPAGCCGRRSSGVSMLLVFFKALPWGEPPSEPCSHQLPSVSPPSPATDPMKAPVATPLRRHQRSRLGLCFTGHTDNGVNNITISITLK